MVDRLSKAHRSWNMSRIRGRDTKPEMIVRSLLHRMGYRFRLHRRDLPGSPDIVLPRHGVVILVHGCFWHKHSRCKMAYTPRTRVEFWKNKFAGNVQRDRIQKQQLEALGWQVKIIWECETKDSRQLVKKLAETLPPTKSRLSH